jgi:hypothetical protein
MRYMAAVVLVLILGCAGVVFFDSTFGSYKKVCVEGVWYLQFANGVTPMLDPTGQVRRCKIEG